MHYFYCVHDVHRRLSRNFDAVQQVASLVLVSPRCTVRSADSFLLATFLAYLDEGPPSAFASRL